MLLAQTLISHTRAARERVWQLTTLLEEGVRGPWTLEGAWPYWLDGRHSKTVHNDLNDPPLILLTGPNMAGKSTLARTLMTVSLLGNCGLMVPAYAATLPRFDAFLMRMSNADSPADCKSAFAMEMQEVGHAQDIATDKSLVMLDEMGKGTEPDQVCVRELRACGLVSVHVQGRGAGGHGTNPLGVREGDVL